jgi:hypothetical protein
LLTSQRLFEINRYLFEAIVRLGRREKGHLKSLPSSSCVSEPAVFTEILQFSYTFMFFPAAWILTFSIPNLLAPAKAAPTGSRKKSTVSKVKNEKERVVVTVIFQRFSHESKDTDSRL